MGRINTYTPRFPAWLSEDKATSDDFLTLVIDAEKNDRATFCHETMPELIKTFEAYRATLETDRKVWVDDHMNRVNLYRGRGPDRDGRDTVERIAPVNFFDDILCRRAFGIGAEEVVRRAAPECERAEHMLDGAFLLVTTDIVTGRPALDALHDRVMRRIDADARRER